MSKETLQWLNENTLIGFTDKRGRAWHYRKGADNHYAGPVPVEDVRKRLFDWEAQEKEIYVASEGGAGRMVIPGRKAIVRSDNGHVMGIFGDGYQPHQYDQWLVTNVETILDDDLSVASAGLLKGGAVAWVSVEVPENIVTPEGVAFRPGLLARTSFDGSVATTFGRHITNVVCDNTMNIASAEHGGQVFKIKHSLKSIGRLADAREALGIVYDAADEFQAEVARLCAIDVGPRDWDKALELLAPLPTPEQQKKSPRGATLAQTKRETLTKLWTSDERVSPWQGTAFGVWQAINTYSHHEAIVRGTSRPERNMLRAIDGSLVKSDAEAMTKVLDLVA